MMQCDGSDVGRNVNTSTCLPKFQADAAGQRRGAVRGRQTNHHKANTWAAKALEGSKPPRWSANFNSQSSAG